MDYTRIFDAPEELVVFLSLPIDDQVAIEKEAAEAGKNPAELFCRIPKKS